MAAPWEKYQSAPTGGKPWEKYSIAPAQDAPQEPPMSEGQMWGQAVKNVAEAGGKLASGVVATPLADAAGLAQIPIHATSSWMNALRSKLLPASIADPLNKFSSIEPADLQDAIKTAGTYQPSNPDSLSNKIVDAPGNVIGGAGEYLRSQSDKLDKSGTLGNVTAALPLAAANILGVKATKLGTFDASKFGGPSNMPLPKGATTEAMLPKVPTTEELTAASKAAYAANKDAGIVVPAKGYETALDNVRSMVKQEGIDPTLHPKSTAVLKRLEDASGKDLSLPEAETLRKIAMDAEDDLNPVTRQPTPDARLAGKIVDELDNSIDQLSTNNDARALWSRSRRSLMLDQMIKRAEIKAGANYTQAGMEHALRQEFKQLALNPRRMRGLTADQRAAVERVAKGGGMENTMRALGKFDPTTGGMAAFASIGTSAAAAPATGGLSSLLPVVGFGARRIATKMTAKNVDLARQALVGRGLPGAPIVKAPISASPPISSIDFQMTPGVMPAKAAALSRGLDFPPAQVSNPTALPAAPMRGLTADTPPQIQGGLPFRNYLQSDAGGLSIAPEAPKYPGGVDFTATPLTDLYAAKLAGDMKLAEPGQATARQTGRAPNMIFSDLRRLEGEVRDLPESEPFDSPKRKALEKKLERLRAELLLSVSKGVSQQ